MTEADTALRPPVEEHITVGVVLEKRKTDNPWVDHVWLPSAILPGAPDVAPWTILQQDGDVTRIYAGAYDIGLYSIETHNYQSNFANVEPKVWIAIRETDNGDPMMVAGVTVDPSEGEAFTEAGRDTVEAVPMPPEIVARVAAFIDDNHIERGFFKRKRNDWNKDKDGARRGGGAHAPDRQELDHEN